MLRIIKDYFIRFSKAPLFSPQGFLIRGIEISFILSRPKTLPFRARIGNGRSSIPPWSPSGFSPRGSIFLMLYLFGCKQYVGSLFGTTFSGGITPIVYIWRLAGVLYGFFYFAFIFIAPIFCIAAVFFWMLLHLSFGPRNA